MTHEDLVRLVERLERSVWQATMKKNGTKLRELFADDYVEITLSGKRVIKDQVVAESPQSDEISAYMVDEVRVTSLSSGLLLMSYHLAIEGTYLGDSILPRDRWATSIWRSEEGSWKCCLFQQSPYAINNSNE